MNNAFIENFDEIEEFMTYGYFKIQQALSNSQQKVEELLNPLFEDKSISESAWSKPKEDIDTVSKNLKNSLSGLQKMHMKQNMILTQFKNLTHNFKSFSTNYQKKDMSTQTDLSMHNVQEIGNEERKLIDDRVSFLILYIF